MDKETKNSALATALSFHYQVLIGLNLCFELREGESIFFEKDGDVSLIGESYLSSQQIEVKNYSDSLTDNHLNFWKTLSNWLQPEFEHTKYRYLVLHTTQPFGISSSLKDWNSINVKERLELIMKICNKNKSNTSEIATIQRKIMSLDVNILHEILEKLYLHTLAENSFEIIEKIQYRLVGIPKNNLPYYFNELVGFLYGEANNNSWEIKYKTFYDTLIHLTSIYARKTFAFPSFIGVPATSNEIDANKTKLFVEKILDIGYEDELPEAIGNWLEVVNSLNADLDNSPTYQEITINYQKQLISMFKRKYSTASRNNHNPKDFYDEVVGEPPFNINDYGTPHLAYKNGLLHHAMDDDSRDLKWNCLK